MNFFTSIIGLFALVISFVLFGALVAVAIGNPGVFLLTIGGVLWALIAWGKRSQAFTKPVYFLENPYLDRGPEPEDIKARREGKPTSLD